MGAYIIVTLIATLIIIILSIIPAKKKSNTLMDELNSNPEFKRLRELYDIMHNMNEEGTDQDMIPNGYGQFGYDVTNPIPVNTIFGNTAYLGRLRTLEGIKVTYVRIGSFTSPLSNYPIDGYEIFDGGQKIAVLYIDPSNKKNSQKAPKNFKLIS
ncbi:MAG: hypothetical protein JXB49_34605 [Bacteroidales bacterium]|nr:hypothetical protein [Bacteroidales bacterium]